jgi:NADH dehydrogenase (ubiquinone) Fe-S protein 4
MSVFTGAPAEMMDQRVVKIFQPSQGVQNATQNTLVWKVQWEDKATKRWTNPLMGWSSTSDPLSNTHMTMEFSSKDEAIRFCERNCWKFEVLDNVKPNRAIMVPKKYADNFRWKGPKGRDFPELYEPPPPPKS